MLNKLSKKLLKESEKIFGKQLQQEHPLASLMLVVSELSEVAEAIRIPELPIYQVQTVTGYDGGCLEEGPTTHIYKIEPSSPLWSEDKKPEGEATEVADALIRLLQYAAMRNLDLDTALRVKREYNKTRNFGKEKKTI